MNLAMRPCAHVQGIQSWGLLDVAAGLLARTPAVLAGGSPALVAALPPGE